MKLSKIVAEEEKMKLLFFFFSLSEIFVYRVDFALAALWQNFITEKLTSKKTRRSKASNRQAEDETERLKRSQSETGIKQGNRRRKEKKRLPQCIPICTQKTTSVGAPVDGFYFRPRHLLII